MSELKGAGNAVPSDTVTSTATDLSLLHEGSCVTIESSVRSIEAELAGQLDREERGELASAVQDVESLLSGLYRAKDATGFFDGPEGSTERFHERMAHLKSDYRRLLNELRQVEHEIVSGKQQKARRMLTHWLSQFSDVIEREADLMQE